MPCTTGGSNRSLRTPVACSCWTKLRIRCCDPPAGIVHAPIDHVGCSQRSDDEVALVRAVYDSAIQQRYVDKEGVARPMSPENILVVTPYNVQVNHLKRMLPEHARAGRVDKFQGQEAELVIVSMTTSSELDLPRNIEFLLSKNR